MCGNKNLTKDDHPHQTVNKKIKKFHTRHTPQKTKTTKPKNKRPSHHHDKRHTNRVTNNTRTE
jgi:hypothetical protein